MHNFNRPQKGISLIEILIALLLGVVILFGATRSLSGMISSSRLQMGNNDMQQTADTALSYIGHRLRNALSTPCDKLSILHTNGKLNISTLTGKVSNETITLGQQAIIKNLLNGHGILVSAKERTLAGKKYKTDNLIIINTVQRAVILSDTGMDYPTINLAEALPYSRLAGNRSLFAVTNCESMDVFRGTLNATGKKITPFNNADGTKTGFRENYRPIESSMVSRVAVSEIKISKNGNLLDKTLFKNSGGSLMGDVELLRALFSVDAKGNDGIADSYVSAAQVNALPAGQDIISAELFLIVKNGQPDKSVVPASYSINIPKTDVDKNHFKGDIFADANSDTLTFTDRVMRKLFVRTITFRNNAAL